MSGHRSCKILILFFFTVYAISPVAFGISAAASPYGPQSDSRTFSSATLYVFKVLSDVFAAQDDADEHEPVQHVLVHKKKALRRELNRASGSVHSLKDIPVLTVSSKETSVHGTRRDVLRPRVPGTSTPYAVLSGRSPPHLS